jgi:zinc protease
VVAADVAALHARLFQPAQATLIVVGDTTADRVDAAALRALGSWASAGPPLARAAAPAQAAGPRVVLLERSDLLQVGAWVFARGPSADDRDIDALEILARLLGGHSARLRDEVRVEQGAAYGFGSGLVRWRTASILNVGGSFDPDKVIASLRAVVAAVAAVRDQGAGQPDFERARTSLLGQWRSQVSSTFGIANLAAAALGRGQPLAAVEAYPERLQAVTPADLRRVAQRYLAEGEIHVLVVGPGSLRAPLAALGLGPVERRNAQGQPVH